MIYIATDLHGKGVRFVTAFVDREELFEYAYETLASNDVTPKRGDSIATLCDILYDHGVGSGARSHYRVSLREAQAEVRRGADGGWLNSKWRNADRIRYSNPEPRFHDA